MFVVGATQWARRRLTRLLLSQPPPTPTSSCLGTFCLPAEIILMISSHLDNLSATYLALTCRYLYYLHSPEIPTLNQAEKTQLLLWLEENIANACFCQPCLKLHRWHGKKSKSILPRLTEHLPRGHRQECLYFLPFEHVPYLHARLIMNRHLRGREHGPLPSILDIPTHTAHYQDGIRHCSARHARIVDDQLLLMTVITIFHVRGDPNILSGYIQFTPGDSVGI
ncbi:hypothetical protein IQ06DRAFT_298242 [Phaeosphaeriaceae sp. SRC1lsM3a]|nr:hypothetical protein IQ06DRAFT_298242 [Stagonospora sp. SRC1lsM3a]